MRSKTAGVAMLVSAIATTSDVALGQEAINFDSALQPGKGATIMRTQLRYFEAEVRAPGASRDIEQWVLPTSIVHGLSADATLILNVRHIFRKIDDNFAGTSDRDNGFGDVRLLGKFKLWGENTGPNETQRFSLLSGVEIRSGDSNFSSDSYDPILGLVWTRAMKRWGYNARVQWQINTGGGADDAILYDTAVSYRLHPDRFAGGAADACYGVLELNGRYDTNGDDELFLSPGVQYITGRWGVEATLQIPVWQELDDRPERDFVAGLIFRMYF